MIVEFVIPRNGTPYWIAEVRLEHVTFLAEGDTEAEARECMDGMLKARIARNEAGKLYHELFVSGRSLGKTFA